MLETQTFEKATKNNLTFYEMFKYSPIAYACFIIKIEFCINLKQKICILTHKKIGKIISKYVKL